MQKTYLTIATILFSSCLFSCNSGNKEQTVDNNPIPLTFDTKNARSFIDSMNAKFTEQFRNGDSLSLAAHYGPDAEMLFENQEPIRGKDILSTWGSIIRSGIKNSTRDFTFTTTNLTGDKDFLIETGTYELKNDKKALIEKGKYLEVYQLRNGEWRLYRDIGNTSLPVSK